MDSLTHTLIGACLGEAIAGKKLGKKAMLIGIMAHNLPDIDMVASFWESQVRMLLVHRGITHSIIFNIFVTFILSYLFQRIYKKYEMPFNKWLLLFGSGLFLHIFLDAFTAYGTGWFEPFSNYRVTFNTIFILDPVFMLPVLIATIALLILRRVSLKRSLWWKFGLGLSGLYLLFITINKLYVNHVVESNLASQKKQYQKFMSGPTPLNNLLWYIFVKNDQGYYIGYYSLLDKDNNIAFETLPFKDTLLGAPCDEEEVKDLKHFSMDYYFTQAFGDTIKFCDMRFGQLNGWAKEKSPFVFNFETVKSNGKFHQSEFAKFDDKVFPQLWARMKGK